MSQSRFKKGQTNMDAKKESLEAMVMKANAGDRKALETVLVNIQPMIYNLSLKMLLFPEDAEDASQEILVRLMTRLSTFKGQSQFTTWAYRVATNYLLTAKGKKSKEFAMDFNSYGRFIDKGQSDSVKVATNQGELRLLEEEVKVSCTQGLLLCLSPESRLVYILGDILEFNSNEGGRVMAISPETFRQQLSRARGKVRNFLRQKCGLVNKDNPCRCRRKIDFLVNQQLLDPQSPRFAVFEKRSIDLLETISGLERETAIYRSNPVMEAPDALIRNAQALLTQMGQDEE